LSGIKLASRLTSAQQCDPAADVDVYGEFFKSVVLSIR